MEVFSDKRGFFTKMVVKRLSRGESRVFPRLNSFTKELEGLEIMIEKIEAENGSLFVYTREDKVNDNLKDYCNIINQCLEDNGLRLLSVEHSYKEDSVVSKYCLRLF